MAAAAIVSVVVALAALVVSIVGLVRSNTASKDAQAARENATSAQWKMSEHLEAIAEPKLPQLKQQFMAVQSRAGRAGSSRHGWCPAVGASG